MKENLLTRIFGSGEKKAAEPRVEARKSETTQAETVAPTKPSDDKAKRNADFWNSVNRNMGDAHSAAANLFMRPCSPYENKERDAYQKAVLFAGLITSSNGAMERAKAKYHTDDLYQVFRKVSMEDLI